MFGQFPRSVRTVLFLCGAVAFLLPPAPARADRFSDQGCDLPDPSEWVVDPDAFPPLPDFPFDAPDPFDDVRLPEPTPWPDPLDDLPEVWPFPDDTFDSCDLDDVPFDPSGRGLVERGVFRPAATAIGSFSAYKFNNTGFTLDAGEPTEGGAMTRTAWFRLPRKAVSRRVVLDTVGSSVDTVLAVYIISVPHTLTRVAGNNDFPVPGVSTTSSLVQFTADAGKTYWVQVGSVGGAQGDMVLNVHQFDPQGGLAALLVDSAGRDYVCATLTCPEPRAIVYNATDQALTVVPSTTLPTRFTAPPTFGLVAGSLSVQAFAPLTPGDFTVRTEIGKLEFSGQASGLEVSRATFRAITKVGGSPSSTLALAVLPSGRAGRPNQTLTAFATVIGGAQPATGCVLRAVDGGDYNVNFQETDPATNVPIGQPDTPVDIAAGATRTFVFSIRAQRTELGDPSFASSPIMVDCASQAFAPINAANSFSLSTTSSFDLADMISIGATSTNDGVLDVPAAGAAFAVSTVNIGANRSINARPVYVRPFSDGSNQVFNAFICETNPTTGQCLAPPATSVTFTARRNQVHTLAVFVQRPANAPAFDPGQRRMLVEFRMMSTRTFFGQNAIPVSVGSTSVAVRAQ